MAPGVRGVFDQARYPAAIAAPRQPAGLDDLLKRAQSAKAAYDEAGREWDAVRQELRAVEETALPSDVRRQIALLLRDDEPAPAHRRWRPAPS